MAWYNSGNWTGVKQSDYGRIVCELCNALNEIRDCVALPLIEWHKPDGTSIGETPALTDLDDLRIDNVVYPTSGNLALLKSTIETMIFPGVLGSSGYVGWCYADDDRTIYPSVSVFLNAATSYGSSWVTPTNRADMRLLLQIRQAIDALKYPVVFLFVEDDGSSSAKTYYKEQTPPGWSADPWWGDLWLLVQDEVPASLATRRSIWSINQYLDGGTRYHNAQIATTVSWAAGKGLHTQHLKGSLLEGVSVLVAHFAETYTRLDITATSGSHSVTVPDNYGGWPHLLVYNRISRGTSWPNIGSVTRAESITITTAPPTDRELYPFEGYAGYLQFYWGDYRIPPVAATPPPDLELTTIFNPIQYREYYDTQNTSCQAYLDISGELTYG